MPANSHSAVCMQIYNTLARKKEVLRPIESGNIGLYTCGPTVYFYAHIGNMRTKITEDLLKRTLVHKGYAVKHVMNLTDVGHSIGDDDIGEDKVRAEAKKEHKNINDIIGFYTEKFLEEERLLNIIPADIMCRASQHIKQMLLLIKKLDEKGYVYRAGNGMYFDTFKFKRYGELLGSSFEKLNKELLAGARVQRPKGLRNITDFAVWRFAKPEEKEMVWETEYGRGFPGWHIECSAMSMEYLGERIDIHTGGTDLIPVHHTNEIAQSEAATGKRFVRYWVHGAFMTVDGQKMSKSIGNIYTVGNLAEKGYAPLSFRYMALTVHYRNMLNFTFEALKHSDSSLKSLYVFISRISAVDVSGSADMAFAKRVREIRDSFFECVEDDLNIPVALSKMHELVNASQGRKLNVNDVKNVVDAMLEFDTVLGLDFNMHLSSALPSEAAELIVLREKARSEGDFKSSDEIRKRLKKEFRIAVEDTKDGTLWYSSIE